MQGKRLLSQDADETLAGAGAGADVDLSVLHARAAQLHDEYESAQPWPHLVLSGLFPDALVAAVKAECLELAADGMARQDGRAQVKEESPRLPGPFSESVFAVLESDEFVRFLEQVTGIDHLLADPTHAYAGVHRSRPGAFTLIHRDFRRHPERSLYHRVNVLLYLNRDWQPVFGGHLELWPSDMSRCGKVIVPEANTLVLWETHDQTLHGLPDAVACPDGEARIALASYYYTREPRQVRVKRRGPVFARRPQDPWYTGRRTLAQVIRSIVRPDHAF